MAADQRRKRLNGASIVSYGSREQQRAKRKNLGFAQHDLRMKSHISVEWDGSQKRVVAKREQIGITWRQMKPFVNFVSNDHNVLADVLTIPKEFFDLDNLKEVLSYKVWKDHLSENERNLLVPFLPRGLEPHQVVEELLAGNNMHFGNPFLKWGASLCSGDLHPDVIVDQEKHLKSEKRAYYSQLHNYHNDMIGFLVKLKETWESCKDPEKDIVQKIWRSKNVEKRAPSNVNDLRIYDHEGNFTVTSESCSWDAEEKEFSCGNQTFSLKKDEKLQRSRVLEIGSMKGKSTNLVSSDDMHNVGERLKKGDKLSKRNIHSSDGDKYMSCIKISKQQHELVKSMKQSGRVIQSRSLNRVLGNLDNIRVQPYEVFVKEEQNKLHDHWLQLVNKALPAAYANWMERHRQRHAVINSLVVEVKEKPNPLVEEEDNFSPGGELQDKDETNMSLGEELQDQDEDSTTSSGEFQDKDEDNMTSEGGLDKNEDSMKSGDGLQDSGDDVTGREIHSHDEDDVSSENEVQEVAEDEVQNDQSSLKGEVSVARTPENQSPHDSYIGRVDDFNSMSLKFEKNLVSPTSGNASQNKVDYPRDKKTRHDSIDEGPPFNSSSDVWHAVEMPNPFFDTAGTHEYTTHGLSLANPAENEERACLIDLEAGLHQEETGKELLHRQLHDQTFSSYQGQARSDFVQSFLKGDGVLPYHHEQKGSELDFQASNTVIMGESQLPSHFKEPLQTSLSLDQGQRRANEVYTSENISQNIYSNGGRYLVPRQARLVPGQDSLAAVNMTDWTSNTARPPSQSHLNTADFSGHHWFPADQVHGGHGGWNGSDGSSISSHSLGTAANSDQSLFSILSQCNQLHPRSSYDSFRNTDDFLAQRTYGVVDADTSRTNAVAPPASHPLEYFSGREAPSSGLVPDDMAWMSLPHQNDQMGKPYLRSWNR